MFDGRAMGQQIVDAVKDLVGRVRAELFSRVDDLDTRLKEIPSGPKGDPGPRGEPGANAYENAVSLGFQGSVHDWMYTFRGVQGEQGEPGLNGISGESIKGDKGDPGESIKGDKGEDGKSLTVEEVLPVLLPTLSALVDITTKELFNKVPRPVDGKDGTDGKSITLEDMRPLFESEQAKWALDFERRAQDVLRGMGEKIPIPKDGKDGFGFDDLYVIHDGEREVKFAFRKDDRIKEFPFTLPIVIERGVYRPETQYKTGDGVTWGGSYWIALVDTMQKPGEGKDWRLAVKKGRDGRDGEKGERGLEGPKGKDK